jgi:hypothetical protein
MFMRLVHATSVAFFREKTNATEVACTGNAAQQLFAGHNTSLVPCIRSYAGVRN